METKQSSKSSLFLIELIIAIFFFIIAATICIQLFVKSYTISNETISINHAVLWTQNLAEIFTSQDGNYQLIKEIYCEEDCIGTTNLEPSTHLLLLFDTKWNTTADINNASYFVLSTYSQDNSFHYQDIYVVQYDKSDFKIDTLDDIANNEYLISHQRIQKFTSESN